MPYRIVRGILRGGSAIRLRAAKATGPGMTHHALPCSPAPMAPPSTAGVAGVAGLRLHTAARHRALEATPLARALLSPALDHAGYRRVLAAWTAATAPLELAVSGSPHAAALGALVPAPRQALALADLRTLALAAGDPDPAGRAARPVPPPTAALRAATDTPAGLLGLCYVLRGASLGSQVIARHLRAHLGLDAASGAAYFGTEPAGAPSWPRWMAAADARLAEAGLGADEQACHGANAAFDALLAAFAAVPAQTWAAARSPFESARPPVGALP